MKAGTIALGALTVLAGCRAEGEGRSASKPAPAAEQKSAEGVEPRAETEQKAPLPGVEKSVIMKQTPPAPPALDAASMAAFGGDVAAVTRAYSAWPRLTRTPQWAPMMCAQPPAHTHAIAHISASGDQATHGRKLYYLHALDPARYFSDTNMSDGFIGQLSAAKLPGIAQAIVKDAFAPKRAEGDALEDLKVALETGKKDEAPFAYDAEERQYVAGSAIGQFIMIRYAAAREGTDDGWIYATVDSWGTITSIGKVASCMECHVDAPHGRLFGLNERAAGGKLLPQSKPEWMRPAVVPVKP